MKHLKIFATAFFSFLLTACSTFTEFYQKHTNSFDSTLQYLTILYIEGDDGKINIEKARELYAELVKAKTKIDKAGTVSIREVEQWVNSRINWGELSVSRTFAAQKFMEIVQIELTKQADKLDETTGKIRDHSVTVYKIIDVVLSTLEPYQG